MTVEELLIEMRRLNLELAQTEDRDVGERIRARMEMALASFTGNSEIIDIAYRIPEYF